MLKKLLFFQKRQSSPEENGKRLRVHEARAEEGEARDQERNGTKVWTANITGKLV